MWRKGTVMASNIQFVTLVEMLFSVKRFHIIIYGV